LERKITAINFVEAFVTGSLIVIIPLLLFNRGIEIAEIGLILAVMPLVFLFARLLFASIADQAGFKPIFIIEWIARMAALVIYAIAATPLAFAFGKISEGIMQSGFWAVNRTAIFHYAKGKEADTSARFAGLRTLGTAFGIMAAGWAIAVVPFDYVIIALLGFAFACGMFPIGLEGGIRVKVDPAKTLASLSPLGRRKLFWLTSIAMMLYAFAVYPIINLVAPLFMRSQLGYDYGLIGTAFAIYYLTVGLTNIAGMRLGLHKAAYTFAQAFVFVLGASLIAVFGNYIFIPLFVLLALGDGLASITYENIVVKMTKDTRLVSVNIGLLHVPFRVAEFSGIIIAGFLAQYMGFEYVFIVSGISFAAFSFITWFILSKD